MGFILFDILLTILKQNNQTNMEAWKQYFLIYLLLVWILFYIFNW